MLHNIKVRRMNRSSYSHLALLLAISVLSCQSPSTNVPLASEHAPRFERGDRWVQYGGSRLDIIQEGDLSANVSLDSLLEIQGLYAIGPIEGLQGEVTIYDGQASIASMEGDTPVFTSYAEDISTIFLAYGVNSDWVEMEVYEDIHGLEALERFVKERLIANLQDKEEPFIFRFEGEVDSLDYHIIYKQDDAPHNMAEHQKAKQRFSMSDVTVKLLGFWADEEGEGVYTHPGFRTHVHFMTEDPMASGHLDDIQLRAGSSLLLPKRK